jgi:hypothetical protein
MTMTTTRAAVVEAVTTTMRTQASVRSLRAASLRARIKARGKRRPPRANLSLARRRRARAKPPATKTMPAAAVMGVIK